MDDMKLTVQERQGLLINAIDRRVEQAEERLEKALSVIGNLEQRIKELESEVFVSSTEGLDPNYLVLIQGMLEPCCCFVRQEDAEKKAERLANDTKGVVFVCDKHNHVVKTFNGG